ncbi:hypothetical protein GPECTOR_1g705 [Gonium pectorale]|uniref:Uncharacterized protein n=1 Tax=Gonium pectorale TaxID=33097 RepID=A0A150H3Z0_GONPE|nr:hypothetical protein GPECTOR_1g705 [Gonium pectorale]|eukprot:KXZ56783.1 hypothetical protein GPECTOR_1g705 [Gonium pectorale]
MLAKRALAYVPWVALIAFVFIFVGIIVWATGTNTALSSTNGALSALGVEAEGYINMIHSAAVGAVVVCAIMAAIMVGMSGGRTCLEKAVDQRGKAVCGSWLWLATEALLGAIWWLILFWLVFVIFGSCLWYGATYTVRGVLQVSLNTANAMANMTTTLNGVPTPFGGYIQGTNITVSGNSTTAVVAPAGAVVYCPSNCLNLALFDFLVQRDICVCDVGRIITALTKTNKAYDSMGSVVAGSFLMWVGASFLLMNAVADFAKTKRERELLLRAQRAAVDSAATQLALGTAPAPGLYPPGFQHDAMPLLKTQALQQQQQQMQMAQLMAQAQAAQMVRPPAAAGGSTNSSHANLGSAV